MKILIVDDERAFGSLLGRALKKLGHKATIVCHPTDALNLLDDSEHSFDAVITDIDMPVMNGVDLAVEIRRRCGEIPIAFSTGSAPEDDVLRAAARLGKVLPKVWTVADVKVLVEHLGKRLALGSDSIAPVTPAPQPAPAMAARREGTRRLRLVLDTWDEVQKLCDRQASSKPYITLRGANAVTTGQKVTVTVVLPDELALSIGATVVTCNRDPNTGKFVFAVHLHELTPEVCTRLRSMCVSAGTRNRGGSYRKIERPAELERAATSPVKGKPIGSISPRRR
jgi:CheY-like chemotaxis protein